MRFPIFIIALIVSEVAYARTPLPQPRPPGAAARVVMTPLAAAKDSAKIPLPRQRPSASAAATEVAKVTPPVAPSAVPRTVLPEQPARPPVVPPAETAMKDAPSKPAAETPLAETPVAPPEAPMTRFKPEQAIKRAARAEAEYKSVTRKDRATAAEISAEIGNAASREPHPEDEPSSQESGMRPADQMEEPEALKAEAGEAAPKMQLSKRSEAPPAAPVSPAESARPDRLDAQRQQTPEALKSDGPASATITPSELKQLAQMQQGVPALPALFKKVPQPKKRPLGAWPRPDDLVFRDVYARTADDECDAVVNSGIIVAERLPSLGRWGACYVPHAVRVSAIRLLGGQRVDIVPPAKLRCGMALAVANWVRGEVAPAATSLGAKFVGIRQLDSYNCRKMSSSKRMMSEHSMGNALDIAELMFANHNKAPLYGRTATQKTFRSKLRTAACRRFKTVLGPGVPQHHDHIHIDLRKHYSGGGICHWNL